MDAHPNTVARFKVEPNADDRLVPVMDEIAAALGLREPAPIQMGGLVEIWGLTPQKLREVVAGIETNTKGVIYCLPDE